MVDENEVTNYWDTGEKVKADEEFEEVEGYESSVEEEVEEASPVDSDTVRLEVVYSKLKYQGTVYNVGEVLELPEDEADDLLETLSGRPRRHLEFVD